MRRIDKEVPVQLQIHLICDKYGTHKTPAIKACPAKHPRFHLYFAGRAAPLADHRAYGTM